MTYYCELEPDTRIKGRYSVIFPDIKGCVSQGNNKDHALVMAKEALEGILECGLDKGRDIPLPINRSDEGLFPITVDKDIAKRILTSKEKVSCDSICTTC